MKFKNNKTDMNNLKQLTKDFLCACEGYHQILKELHWSANSRAIHELTNDMDGSVLDYEDRIAECVMGILDIKFSIGDLKTLIPSGKNISDVLTEMKKDVIEYKENVKDESELSGLQSILDEFVASINNWNYLKMIV